MVKRIVFISESKGIPLINEQVGYLNSLVDQGVLDNIIHAEIWGEEDITLWFKNDQSLKNILSEVKSLGRYIAIRADVANESRLEDNINGFLERYELEYTIYETKNSK